MQNFYTKNGTENIMTTTINFEAIANAITEQIKNPARAVVNSESAFVHGRLQRAGFSKEASVYWNWSVGMGSKYEIPANVVELQKKLEAIDAGVSMPDWGYSGT